MIDGGDVRVPCVNRRQRDVDRALHPRERGVAGGDRWPHVHNALVELIGADFTSEAVAAVHPHGAPCVHDELCGVPQCVHIEVGENGVGSHPRAVGRDSGERGHAVDAHHSRDVRRSVSINDDVRDLAVTEVRDAGLGKVGAFRRELDQPRIRFISCNDVARLIQSDRAQLSVSGRRCTEGGYGGATSGDLFDVVVPLVADEDVAGAVNLYVRRVDEARGNLCDGVEGDRVAYDPCVVVSCVIQDHDITGGIEVHAHDPHVGKRTELVGSSVAGVVYGKSGVLDLVLAELILSDPEITRRCDRESRWFVLGPIDGVHIGQVRQLIDVGVVRIGTHEQCTGLSGDHQRREGRNHDESDECKSATPAGLSHETASSLCRPRDAVDFCMQQ